MLEQLHFNTLPQKWFNLLLLTVTGVKCFGVILYVVLHNSIKLSWLGMHLHNQIKVFMRTFQSFHSNCSGPDRNIHKPVSPVDQSKLTYSLYTDHINIHVGKDWNYFVCTHCFVLPWPMIFRNLKFLARIIDSLQTLFWTSSCTFFTYRLAEAVF